MQSNLSQKQQTFDLICLNPKFQADAFEKHIQYFKLISKTLVLTTEISVLNK